MGQVRFGLKGSVSDVYIPSSFHLQIPRVCLRSDITPLLFGTDRDMTCGVVLQAIYPTLIPCKLDLSTRDRSMIKARESPFYSWEIFPQEQLGARVYVSVAILGSYTTCLIHYLPT